MKVVVLAGGLGTRMAEYTETIPKPMVTIGNKPVLWHIMQRYSHYGHNDFVIALGYKAEIIKEYFVNYHALSNDITVDLGTGKVSPLIEDKKNWSVSLVDTGLNTMTGGRVKRISEHVKEEKFFLTYGDGVADVDIDSLLDFHNAHGKMVTVTAVHPTARFGELEIKGDQVISFKEKPQTRNDWINGGFFVIEPEFLELIDGDETILEHEPLEKAAQSGELMAYRHDGFWQCMDTKRDRDVLENMWKNDQARWKV